LKVAIFHDFFSTIGGGERVVIAMAKALDAQIITTDTDVVRQIDSSICVISLGKTLKYPGFKQISAMLKFYFCDFSQDYDLFIFSGNWAHFAAHRHHPNLWYCHILIPFLYDEKVEFTSSKNPIKLLFFRIWKSFHSRLDIWSIKHVDQIIANSKHIRKKIFLYYKRSADMIYPPVETKKYYCIGYQDFWLSLNRIYPEKRIELQVASFKKIPEESLIIVGGFPEGDHSKGYAEKILRDLPDNVSVLGQIPEEELISLLARCKGFICTSINEPFGISLLEAMASGKPVIAVDSGGYRETVTIQTGLLVESNADSIVDAVRLISKNPEQYHDACIARAYQFDQERFAQELRTVVSKYHNKND